MEVAVDVAGLARALQGGLDLALVDIDLPAWTAWSCAAACAEPATAPLPLLALSANAMPSEVRRAMQASFDAYLTKPIDVVQLLGKSTAASRRTASPRGTAA